ncbi:MAG: ankyrin repeat domain-containing protein [bacterium]
MKLLSASPWISYLFVLLLLCASAPAFAGLPQDSKALTEAFQLVAAKDAVGLTKALTAAPELATAKSRHELTTLLHAAAGKASLDCVTALLAAGADVNALDCVHETPLHVAARAGITDVLRALTLAKGAQVNCVNKDGETPLHLAVNNLKTSAVATLLAQGATVSARRNDGCTPLQMLPLSSSRILQDTDNPAKDAAAATKLDRDNVDRATAILRILLKAGADQGAVNEAWETPLMTALRQGQPLAVVKVFLEEKPAVALATTNSLGESPLFYAVKANPPVDVVKALLAAGADPNQPNKTGRTVLFVASGSKPEVWDALLAGGANIDYADPQRNTPIFNALAPGNETYAKYLISKGAVLTGKTVNGDTVLNTAVTYCNLELLKQCLETKKCDINAQDGAGLTALHTAIAYGKLDRVLPLLEAGANPNIGIYISGATPIFLTVEQRLITTMRLLLQHGADANISLKSKQTLLEYTKANNADEMVNILKNAGAKE